LGAESSGQKGRRAVLAAAEWFSDVFAIVGHASAILRSAASPELRNILGQTSPKYDLACATNNRRIFIANVAPPDFHKRRILVANLAKGI
jgi:hypothetical protein